MSRNNKKLHTQSDLLMWLVPLVLVFGLIVGSAWQEDHIVVEFAENAGLVIAIVAMIGRAWTYLFLENTYEGIPVIQGPFRYVAHPLHFFASVAIGGFGLMMGSYLAGLSLFLIGYLISRILIVRNEKIKRKHISEEQDLYLNIVPDFFPSLTARITADGQIDQPAYSAQTLRFILLDLTIFFSLLLSAEFFDFLHESGKLPTIFHLL